MPARQARGRPPAAADVDIQFARSSGAGGQNVNKVNTKVDMRIHLDRTPWLDEEIREAVKRAVRGAGGGHHPGVRGAGRRASLLQG